MTARQELKTAIIDTMKWKKWNFDTSAQYVYENYPTCKETFEKMSDKQIARLYAECKKYETHGVFPKLACETCGKATVHTAQGGVFVCSACGSIRNAWYETKRQKEINKVCHETGISRAKAEAFYGRLHSG